MLTGDRYLQAELYPGMFGNEYTAILVVDGRRISCVVPKEHVRVANEPSAENPGSGLLAVQILQESESEALVDLRSPAFTSEPRFRVPVGDLRLE
jgi:hypothetical protein